ncbi:helix-turn-helix transcriptional regulator [Algoriphagus aestuariicola]|uniref:Helix-turn-helix transcriptional regulator n=1 Tax=Algoriphagus aestuariicola TaxID=1852016 RepID=A0ABS3BWB5_9BACT|nr:helix-turn-helix domain-containing protein [Algoriphagus aestuariicola]MBN7802635.1 helix-turn-helix transcriptional regulator [Algoriphagus aestuariicola]
MGRKPNYKNEDFIKKVSARILEIAKEKDLGQDQIAELFQADDNRQIGRVLRGETNYGISELERFAKILKVHPKVLLDFDWE